MVPRPADASVDRREGPPSHPSVVRSAVIRFTLSSLAAAMVVTGATLAISARIAEALALEDAQAYAVGIVEGLVAPRVDEDVRARRPGAADELHRVMDHRVRVQHVRVWSDAGDIIWSDKSELMGERLELSPDVSALFGSRAAHAYMPATGSRQPLTERTSGPIEVRVGSFDRDGEPLVVEIFLLPERIEHVEDSLVSAFVPLTVGSLLLLVVLVLPLAVALGRRVERAQAEHAVLTRHALLASEHERRRITEELHDEVVPELAALSYGMGAAAARLEEGGDPARARQLLARATEALQNSIDALRTRMTDIYPADLRRSGLRDAVRQLGAAAAEEGGVEVRLEVSEALEVPEGAGGLAYRVVREGLSNVVKHADAGVVVVELTSDASHVNVRITDDGRGPGDQPGESPRDHFGLRLLSDALRDFGGWLDVHEREEGGTVLTARFPRAPALA